MLIVPADHGVPGEAQISVALWVNLYSNDDAFQRPFVPNPAGLLKVKFVPGPYQILTRALSHLTLPFAPSQTPALARVYRVRVAEDALLLSPLNARIARV